MTGRESARQHFGTWGKGRRDEEERAQLAIDCGPVSRRERHRIQGYLRPDSRRKWAQIVERS